MADDARSVRAADVLTDIGDLHRRVRDLLTERSELQAEVARLNRALGVMQAENEQRREGGDG